MLLKAFMKSLQEREREVNKTHVKTSAQLEEEISSKVHVKYVDVYVHQ